MTGRLARYLEDPFLAVLWTEIRQAGPIRSISVDLTHECNIRCRGCYFFAEGMDRTPSPTDSATFEDFVQRELKRGTNLITVVGGEPTLALSRLKTLHDHFNINVATNGMIPIPREGFEGLPIGVSVWGDHATDVTLRGGGRVDVFARALRHYRDDPRAFWYYTVTPGGAAEVERVVQRCVDNGNLVLFNYYGDLQGHGGSLGHRTGFDAVKRAIDRAIDRWPDRILNSYYLNEVVAGGKLCGETWGYDVCASVTADAPVNRRRVANGKPYNAHFRAYNADLRTTRRCCTGIDRDCDSCFDVWQHFSWIMLNARRHMGSRAEFTRWLTTTWLFYLINRLVDFDAGLARLPEIHRASGNFQPTFADSIL